MLIDRRNMMLFITSHTHCNLLVMRNGLLYDLKIGIYRLVHLRDVQHVLLEIGIVKAQFLKNIGLGIDTSEVYSHTSTSVKSGGRNYCLPKNEYNQRWFYKKYL